MPDSQEGLGQLDLVVETEIGLEMAPMICSRDFP